MLWQTPLACTVSALAAASLPSYLYLKVKARFLPLERKLEEQAAELESVKRLAQRVTSTEIRLAEMAEQKTQYSDWISQADSLNLNRRGQVLRLHRRGDSVPDIASALRMGHGEVQLMIKVYELSKDSPKSEVSVL